MFASAAPQVFHVCRQLWRGRYAGPLDRPVDQRQDKSSVNRQRQDDELPSCLSTLVVPGMTSVRFSNSIPIPFGSQLVHWYKSNRLPKVDRARPLFHRKLTFCSWRQLECDGHFVDGVS